MNVGTVRKIIEDFKTEIDKTANEESKKLSRQLNDLFDDLNDCDLIDVPLGAQLKLIITQFWQQASLWPVNKDWATNPTVSAWLKLQENLQETKWDIQEAHHGYFYHCWEFQYNQSGDGKMAVHQLMPVLIRCCRMLGYAEKTEVSHYPFSRLTSKIELIDSLRKEFLIDGVKGIVTSLSVLFYLLYHYCSPEQLAILPWLIKYRVNTTDEERRSETAVVTTLSNDPQQALDFFRAREMYIEGREIIANPTLKSLTNLIPNSRKKLSEGINDKPWYYRIIKTIYTEELVNLVAPLVEILEQDFAQQKDQSYPAALSFTEKVIQQFINLSPLVKEKLVSALHYFCLEHYRTLCTSNVAKSPLLWFSPTTKSNAATKLQQREKGIHTRLGLIEWAATREGRLNHLITLFDDYKNDIEAQVNEKTF